LEGAHYIIYNLNPLINQNALLQYRKLSIYWASIHKKKTT